MNWWLIVVACIVSLLLLALSVYVMLIYVADEDRDSAWFAKVVTVFGLTLACVIVLLLPFDVANGYTQSAFANLYGGGLNTELMWTLCLGAGAVFIVLLVPFAMFFYEAYDPDHHWVQQFPPAIIFTVIVAVVFVAATVVPWVLVGEADIPYYSYNTGPQLAGPLDVTLVYKQVRTAEKLTLKVSYFVYMVAVVVVVGWVLFIVYGGVGIVALPIDTLIDWVRRPKPMPGRQYHAIKEEIAVRAGQLLQVGQQLEHSHRMRASNAVRRNINAFSNEVMLLQAEFQLLEVSYKDQGTGLIKTVAWVIGGVCSIGVSLLWTVHMVVYNAFRLHPFLNTLLLKLDSAFSLLGTAVYAFLAFYLLLCAVKGCIKVGMRIVFFQVYPMRMGDTLMNALLFNTGLVLLTAVTVTQFCAQSFDQYAATSAANALLNVYVRRLKGLGLIMGYFQYAVLAVSGLSIIWIVICPRKKVKKKTIHDMDVT